MDVESIETKIKPLENIISPKDGAIPNVTFSGLKLLNPGMYVVVSGVTTGVPDSGAGNLIVFPSIPNNRIFAMIAFDNNSVYVFTGHSGGSGWAKIR